METWGFEISFATSKPGIIFQ